MADWNIDEAMNRLFGSGEPSQPEQSGWNIDEAMERLFGGGAAPAEPVVTLPPDALARGGAPYPSAEQYAATTAAREGGAVPVNYGDDPELLKVRAWPQVAPRVNYGDDPELIKVRDWPRVPVRAPLAQKPDEPDTSFGGSASGVNYGGPAADNPMQDEIDALRAKYKGQGGHQAQLEIKGIENKYGVKPYANSHGNATRQLESQAYAELAKIPPGASNKYWEALGANVNRALKHQAAAAGETWRGNSRWWSDPRFWSRFDLTTLGDHLRPVVDALQATTKQLGLKEPSEATLRTWVEAEDQRGAFLAKQPANIDRMEDAYAALSASARRSYLNQHPELKEYLDDLAAWKKDPANKTALMFYYPDDYKRMYGNLRTTGTSRQSAVGSGQIARGGGRAYDGGGARAAAASPTAAYTAIETQLTASDPELLQQLQAWLSMAASDQPLYARRNPRLAGWLATKDPAWLAALRQSYIAWLATKIGAPRQTSSKYSPPGVRYLAPKSY